MDLSLFDEKTLNVSKSICLGSFTQKRVGSLLQASAINNIKLNETKYLLKEGEYINEGIKIIKLLFQTATSKFYLAQVEEIHSDILIKNTELNITEEDIALIDKAIESLETIQLLIHSNIISYFNVDITFNDESNILTLNTSMEYFKGISLYQYLYNHNRKSKVVKGLPLQKVKTITKGILNGLGYLNSKMITHSELNPSNVLVNEEDPSQVKIVNYALRVKKEDIQKNPYYSSPELSFHKTINKDTDIWSLGAIVFELFTGKKPYSDLTPLNAMCKLAQFVSPIEAADDSIKDIIYDKSNRSLLDFLLKCFRTNENTRPEAIELLEHKFLN